MGTRLASLLVKEMIQFFRDRVILILILWLYTVEVMICAYALSFDVKNLAVAVVDLDRSPASRRLVDGFDASEAFVLAGRPASMSAAQDWLERGRASLALVIPEGFERDLRRDEPPAVQVLLDGSNSNTASIARGYVGEVLARFGRGWLEKPPAQIEALVRIWYNPSQTFTSFMVLSMIALAALMVGVIHPAATIVREKEIGTIEQLRITPIATGELFFAKTIPTLLVGLASVFPSLLIVWWFGVPLRGSLALFMLLTALFLLSTIGIGVLVAGVCRTMQQALLLSFFGLFPIMFLSGTLVPIESMPASLQYLSLASPLRHYMDIILGVFLKGAGLTELWPQTLTLLAIGAILFALALLAFRRLSA